MSRNRRSLLSDATKIRLAQAEGAAGKVAPGDYGNLTSKEAGDLVKLAVSMAERTLQERSPQA